MYIYEYFNRIVMGFKGFFEVDGTEVVYSKTH